VVGVLVVSVAEQMRPVAWLVEAGGIPVAVEADVTLVVVEATLDAAEVTLVVVAVVEATKKTRVDWQARRRVQ
jgi:hypothetical protein